jgi:hypothetical protein
MRIGDLVKKANDWNEPDGGYKFIHVGIIIDFTVVYDKWGDAVEKLVVVNWNEDYPCEEEFKCNLEVINESR